MSDARRRPFRYALEPFLRKKTLDWSGAKLQEAQAKALLDRHQQQAAELRGEIEAVERSLRESCATGALLDCDRQRNFSNYLKHTQRGLEAAQKHADDAREVHERISREASALHQGIKALEKHRAGKQAEHAVESRRREYHQLDELWLMKPHEKTPAAIGAAVSKPHSSIHVPPDKGDEHGS